MENRDLSEEKDSAVDIFLFSGCQLLENLEFNYQIMPFDTATTFADIQKRQDLLQSDILCVNCMDNGIEKHKSLFKIDSENILFSTADKVSLELGKWKFETIFMCTI